MESSLKVRQTSILIFMNYSIIDLHIKYMNIDIY